MTQDNVLDAEAAAFDRQVRERRTAGWMPDLRHAVPIEWFYNNVWREPEFVDIQLRPKVQFVVDAALERGGRVVELGCGAGYVTLELARGGLDVLGIDLSPASIELAREVAALRQGERGFGSLNYVWGDFMRYELGADEFDSVVFFGSLHHVHDLAPLLDRVWRSLKPGGRLIVAEPVRQNLTRTSAEVAAVLRAVLPTWIGFDRKLAELNSPEAWQAYVDRMFDEYTYRGEHVQSPCDNATASEEAMLTAIERRFEVLRVRRSDAFIDKLIGGLRGEHRHALARFLKFLDDDFVRRGVLPASHLAVQAVKRDERLSALKAR